MAEPQKRRFPERVNEAAGRVYEAYFLEAYTRRNDRAPNEAQLKRFKKDNASRFSFPAVLARIGSYAKACLDVDMTELLCLEAIRRGGDEFSAVQHLAPLSLDMMRAGMEYASGSWEYALWAYGLEEGQVRQSADYWLGRWSDAVELTFDEKDPDLCRRMLEKLRSLEREDAFVEEVEI